MPHSFLTNTKKKPKKNPNDIACQWEKMLNGNGLKYRYLIYTLDSASNYSTIQKLKP